MSGTLFTVSEANGYIKQLLESSAELRDIFIRGEISNYKLHSSGHHYFTLKDEGGTLRCVMFRREASYLRFRPEGGMRIIAHGRISVFPRDGQYQLYVDGMTPDGAGDLYVAFEQLKAKLGQEGLFDERYKKPLPAFPAAIGIVTSPTGAAIRDMLRIIAKRFPVPDIYIFPVRVQGAEAPAEICEGIRFFNSRRPVDVIITGRGGGSIEDLWAFNDERVARAIFESEVPVISAVGHEPDVTISDYVADVRAATPSNAAEIVVPDGAELRARLGNLSARMIVSISVVIDRLRKRTDTAANSRMLKSPQAYFQDRRLLLDFMQRRLESAYTAQTGGRRAALGRAAAALDALSPLKVLGRGYAIARDADGRVVKSVDGVGPGDLLRVLVSDGEIGASVKSKRKNEPQAFGETDTISGKEE